MLSDDEVLELEVIGQACEPSLLDPIGVSALTFEQKIRLDDLLAKVERGADGATA
jgi:hypothetical protein